MNDDIQQMSRFSATLSYQISANLMVT